MNSNLYQGTTQNIKNFKNHDMIIIYIVNQCQKRNNSFILTQKNIFLLLSVILFFFSCKRETQRLTTVVKEKKIEKEVQKIIFKTPAKVFIDYFWYPDTKNNFRESYLILVEEKSNYIKFSKNTWQDLVDYMPQDSIRINRKFKKKLTAFFTKNIYKLKDLYSDGGSDAQKDRLFYFTDNYSKIFKRSRILGEPKNIDSLKIISDLIVEKINKHIDAPEPDFSPYIYKGQ